MYSHINVCSQIEMGIFGYSKKSKWQATNSKRQKFFQPAAKFLNPKATRRKDLEMNFFKNNITHIALMSVTSDLVSKSVNA